MSNLWKYYLPGYLLALPHSLIGIILMLTWYWPEKVSWSDGCLEVIPKRRRLIGGDWVAGQTFGWVIFYRNADQRARWPLRVHERVHVVQALVLGPLFPLTYGAHFIYLWAFSGLPWKDAYYFVWAEKMAYSVQRTLDTKTCDKWGSQKI